MIRRGRLAAIVLGALALAVPSPAAAESVTGPELVALAAQAAEDPAARERLLAVDEVDGRPVAVRDALAGARGAELTERAQLIVLAVNGAASEASPAADRDRAREVLDDRRYKGSDLPRPLASTFDWLGDQIEPITAWISDHGRSLPGGAVGLWMGLAGLTLLAAGGVTSTSIRRRALAIERERAAALPEAENPQALERAAERAERDGDWERAVRLRFRAGLLRLDRLEVLVYRPSLTTGEVGRAIEAPAFDEVGARFDEIAYGGRPAVADDAEAARRGWKDVLAQVRSR